MSCIEGFVTRADLLLKERVDWLREAAVAALRLVVGMLVERSRKEDTGCNAENRGAVYDVSIRYPGCGYRRTEPESSREVV